MTVFWGCSIPYGEGAAKDLGVQGSVYAVKELDALVWIKRRLAAMQTRGEIEVQQENLKNQALSSIERPSPVKGLKPTEKPRTLERDLTVTVPRDIYDSRHKIIQKAGTRINPLVRVFSKKFLVFLDGDDQKQLEWAIEKYKNQFGLVKLVLVKGAPLSLMQQYEIPFYFDQSGRLSAYFKLEQIPAVVYQEKDKLMISEVKI